MTRLNVSCILLDFSQCSNHYKTPRHVATFFRHYIEQAVVRDLKCHFPFNVKRAETFPIFWTKEYSKINTFCFINYMLYSAHFPTKDMQTTPPPPSVLIRFLWMMHNVLKRMKN